MTSVAKEQTGSKALSLKNQANWWLCRILLPVGFFIQLTGFFWLPHTHIYKVNVANLLLLPALISLFDRNAWQNLCRNRLAQIMFAYLAYMSVIPLFRQNEDPLDCAHRSFYIALYIFAIGQRMNINTRELQQLFIASVLICAGAIIYAISYDIFFLHLWSETYRLAGYGTLYNPLRSGHLFGFFCVVASWLIFNPRNSLHLRIIASVAAVICLAGAVLTGSRAPLLGIALGGFYLIFFMSPQRLFKQSLTIAAVTFISLCALFWKQLTTRGLSLRPEIWAEVIDQWQKHPWFGAGYNAILNIKISVSEETFFDTHNIVLAVLYYGGIVGVLLFSTMHITALQQAFKKQKFSSEAILATSLMIYGLVTLQFDGGSIIGRPNEFWLLLWFPMALLLFIKRNSTLKYSPT